jgi:predicted metalloprotease with PDZ domain
VLGLGLDLTLRSSFKDVTLDSLMRYMWREHGKTEIPYSSDDLRSALAVVTGDEDFANDFFGRYISGHELPDYEALLDSAGLILRPANEEAASVGPIVLEFEGKAAIVKDNTIVGTPAYESGLDRGDQIIAIDRLQIQSQEQWDAALDRFKPGDTATIHYLQREVPRSAQLTFIADKTLVVVSYEADEQKLNRSRKSFRSSWLGDAEE